MSAIKDASFAAWRCLWVHLFVAAWPVLLGALPVAASPASAQRPPNLIMVLSDDVGLSRMSCYGGAPYQTPNLDRLAAEGMRFERAYSMPICGPSRSALLTGKYPFRTGATGNSNSVIDPQKNVTIPLLLKQAGYATCAIGKLGQSADEDDEKAPGRLGFDEYMLWMGRGTPDRYWRPRYHRNGEIVQGQPAEYGPDVTQAFLVDFMRRHAEQPFFVYYSAVLTHGPFTRTPDSKDNTRLIQDMVAYLDKQMGQLAKELDRLGLRDNTILLFTSDNGPQGNPLGTIRGAPMVGEKGDVGEGGVREPFIVNCPKLVPPGRVCRDLTDFTDILPTLVELAGAQLPASQHFDGMSVAPQIFGRPGRARDWVYAQHGKEYFIADAHYKLYHDGRLVDITDSPVAEKPVAASDAKAQETKALLAATLAKLRYGFSDEPPARPAAAAPAAMLRAKTFANATEQNAQLKTDLDVLVKQGVIPNAEPWLALLSGHPNCDGAQAADLLVRGACKFKPATTATQALEILRKEGVISTTGYWHQHAKAGDQCTSANVARFLNKLAQKLSAP